MLKKASFSLILLLILAIEIVYFFILNPSNKIIVESLAGSDDNFIEGDNFDFTLNFVEEADLDIQRKSLPTINYLQPINSDSKEIFEQGCQEIKFGKCIEIDISQQKFYTYQNGFLIGEYMTSTGVRGRDTKLGRFKVLSKHEIAYGYIGGVYYKMPYWLGIYYAGSSENGIHELPYINGVQETDKDLGRRASHGCVRLAKGVAEKVYNWAEIETPVIIHQ